MPAGSVALLPYTELVVASTTAAATANSATLDARWSQLDDIRLILDCTAASGTSPTLDVAFQITPDDGTTFYSIMRFAQVTAVAIRQLEFSTRRHAGQAASEAAVADTGGALAVNGVLSKKVRFRWTITATTPSFTFRIWVVGRQSSGGLY
jgi:hypothetical protein